MKIIVDAMGGDNAPDVTVRGAALAAKEYGEDILLVGQPEAITAVLRAHGLENTEHLTIMPASDIVDMHDDPATILRRKPDSSMAVAFKLLKAGEGDALVSAGNTGALLTGATLYGGRIKGIRRAALAPVLPCEGGEVMLCDAGANTECTAEMLLQFAFLASLYAEKNNGLKSPRVGLVNNGTEDTKGDPLRREAYALLKAAGYDIFELEAGTRKLIFTLPDSGVEIVLAKAADVITYVEHGVCDMGVVGKDTIMEKGGSFYEMVDLGFGRCRFALATKKGKDVYGGYKTPVIATKYPAVTKAFFNRKNLDVETIKIEGSVELAPLLELADAIVDIVETGTTLKENGLEVIEDVAPISARVIVNLASAKMKKTAIQKVIAELEKGLEK